MKRVLPAVLVFLLGAAAAAQPARYIHADIPGDAAYVDSVIRVTHARLQSLLGAFTDDSLDVYVVADETRFDSLAGGFIPDWGAGVAIPRQGRIVIKSPLILAGEKSLGELVAHEYAHVALARALYFRPVPRWLDEGLAMYVSAEWGWADNVAVGWAVVTGGVVELPEIEKLNRFHGDRAQVAYSESYLAVKYFIDTYGRSGLDILLDGLKGQRGIDDAFVAATGADYRAFEQEFSAVLHGRYNLITMIFSSNLLWILLALVIIIGFILNRITRKKRMQRFDEYEKYHSTDFDYGDPEEPDEDKPWD